MTTLQDYFDAGTITAYGYECIETETDSTMRSLSIEYSIIGQYAARGSLFFTGVSADDITINTLAINTLAILKRLTT